MNSADNSKQPPYIVIPPELFINRGEPQTILENCFRTYPAPIIALGGLPGSGVSSLAIFVASKFGKPIWLHLENGEEINELELIQRLGDYLSNFYNTRNVPQKASENDKNATPSTVKIRLVEELFSLLARDNYIIIINNFQNYKKQPGIHNFLSKAKNHIGNPNSRFRGIILVTHEEHPNIRDVYPHKIELHGFTDEKSTRQFLYNKQINLPDDVLSIIHRQTDGYPGWIKLMLSIILLYGDKSYDLIRENFSKQINFPSFRQRIFDLIDDKLLGEQRDVLKYLTLLKHPFNFKNAAEILRRTLNKNCREIIIGLEQIYILSDSINGGGFYSPQYIREYFSQFLDDKEKVAFHTAAAAFYKDEKKYLAAAENHIHAREWDTAAEILTDAKNKDPFINESISTYFSLLSLIKDERSISTKYLVKINMRIGDLLEILSFYNDALTVYEKVLSMKEISEFPQYRARILRKIGWTNTRLCKWEEAIKAYEQAKSVLEEDRINKKLIDDKLRIVEEARISVQSGYIQFLKSEHDGSIITITKAMALLESGVDYNPNIVKKYMAQANLFLGLSYEARSAKGDFEKAKACYEKTSSLYQEVDNQYGVLQGKLRIGLLAIKTGDTDTGDQLINLVYSRARKIQSLKLRGDCFRGKGNMSVKKGNYRHGERYFTKAIEVFTKINDAYGLAWAHNALAILSFERGNYKNAEENWTRSSTIFKGINLPNESCGIDGNLAVIKLHSGNLKLAEKIWKESRTRSQYLPAEDWRFSAEFFLTRIALLKAANLPSTKEQLKLAESCANSPESKVYLNLLRGEYFLARRSVNEAIPHLRNCCSGESSTIFGANVSCKVLLIECLLLKNDVKTAETLFTEITAYVKNSDSILIKAELKRVETMLFVGKNNVSNLLQECLDIYSRLPSSLEIAETQFRIGRIMKLGGIPNADSLLLNAKQLYNDFGARSRKEEVDLLISGKYKTW